MSFTKLSIPVSFIVLAITSQFALSQEDASSRPPKAGYVTCSGSFRLDGTKGEGLYIRPRNRQLFKASLTFYGLNQHVWWYREDATSYFLGFSAYGNCGCGYRVYWGYWDTNGYWHGWLLGWAEKIPLGDVAEMSAVSINNELRGQETEVSAVMPEPLVQSVARVPGTRGFVEIHLPVDAKVWFSGHAMKATGERRVFRSPPLEPGVEFSYDVTAEVERDGKMVRSTRQVKVKAGKTVVLDLR